MKKIKVLFLASEADPFIKIGGLGDVAGSLPNALLDLGDEIDVRLIIPLHKQIIPETFGITHYSTFVTDLGGKKQSVDVFKTNKKNLEVFFLSGEPISDKEKVYDSNIELDGEKYIFFDLAALEFIKRDEWQPSIVMANDWHTAIALHAIKQRQSDPFWRSVKTVITIHNLCYMGAGTEAILERFGISKVNTDKIPWWGKHVPLPMGILAADKIVTVSPTYSKEIQTAEYGCGLEEYFQYRAEDVVGIVNGIDQDIWDPEKDQAIPQTFSISEIDNKKVNKQYLQELFHLAPKPSVPLLAMVTRMDQQKGVDTLLEAIELISSEKYQMIILGTGNPEIEEKCKLLEEKYPEQVRAIIKYDGKLSRQIYAGADMILMPSRYEPCGIAQMISMRYGSVPIVRATGGLKDTVTEERTGFLFEHINAGELAASIIKALRTYKKKDLWKRMQTNCMDENFSWQNSAEKYKNLFESLV